MSIQSRKGDIIVDAVARLMSEFLLMVVACEEALSSGKSVNHFSLQILCCMLIIVS